jgi:hypothetical protein
VQGKVEDLLPLVGLLAPDEDLAVVAGRGQDVAVLGVCPRDAPDGALVALQGLGQALRLALDLEDLDGLVGGACGKAAAIVVEDGIVLGFGLLARDQIWW